jgi:hypothetical protein
MLVYEWDAPLSIKATESFARNERPAALKQQEVTHPPQTSVLYAKVFAMYRIWQKEFVNSFTDVCYAKDLKGNLPQKARFEDLDELRKFFIQVVKKWETIKKNHQQSAWRNMHQLSFSYG